MSIPAQHRRVGASRLLAIVTTFLVALGGLIAVPATAQAAETPTITVTEASRAGGTITITGTGFDASTPPGPPNFGIYVGIAPAGANDFYSAGVLDTVWVAPGNVDGGAAGSRTLKMNADGSFSATFEVPAFAEGVEYSIYTAKAHGQAAAHPSQSTITPVVYEAEIETPTAAPTTTTLTVSHANISVGEGVELEASVTPAEAAGSIVFSNNGTQIANGEVTLVNGVATLTTQFPVGTNNIVATFAPTGELFAASSSAVSTVTVTEAETPAVTPQVTVNPNADLDPAVDNVITITGTGFTGPGAANGAYILFGESSIWSGGSALPAEGWDVLSFLPAFRITDGAFSTTITIPAGTLDPAKSYQVATSAAHGLSVTNRTLDTFTPVTIQQAEIPVTPQVTVTPTTNLDTTVENVLTVTGTGFTGPGAASGTYVLFGETSVWSGGSPTPSAGWVALQWVRATALVDGGFTTTITIPANTLDPSKEYHLATSAAHLLSVSDRSLDTFTPVTLQQPAVTGPQVSVTPNTNLDPAVENVLTITGTGFEGPGAAWGAYVLFGETSVWSGGSATPSEGWLNLKWLRANDIVNGEFSTTITIPAGTLDPSKTYQVATSAAHQLSVSDRSLDTFTPVTLAAGPVDPAVNPSVFTVQQGSQITFNGIGLPAGADVTGTVNSTPVDLGTKQANGQGMVSFTWTVPTDFAVGQHTITLTSGAVVVSSQFVVEALVIVSDGNQAPAIDQCVARSVTGGSLTWGLKASFASYLQSPIANGSFSGGSFNASGGSFNVNDGGVGRANFSGSIVGTGHNNLLRFQLSNPSVQITGPGTAVLFAYVNSTDSSGNPAMSATVAMANLSFGGPTISGDTLSVSNAAATLTAAGAQAFAGFYPAGTALDPVSFSVSLGGEVPCDSTTDPVSLAATGADSDASLAMLSVGGLALLLGFALLRRRRQTA